jgi:hypothetical protein
MEAEYELIMSPLCQPVTHAGHTVEVEIYRGPASGWTLEVVDEYRNSTVWDDQFETDQEAWEEFQRTIAEEGVHAVIGEPPTRRA